MRRAGRLAGAALLASVPFAGWAQDSARASRPALNPAIMASAEALGMVRGVTRRTDLLNTVQYRATGSEMLTKENGVPVSVAVTAAVVGYSYARPSGRVDLQRAAAGGRPAERVIRVVSVDKAWDEATPGVGKEWSPNLALRLADVWVSPHGAIRAAADADPAQVKVAAVAGKTVITTPAGSYSLEITLDAKHFPEKVSTSVPLPGGAKTLVATYSGYKDWDGYDVPFPTRVTHHLDGVKVLDLTVNEFRSNPYVVFPAPTNLAAR